MIRRISIALIIGAIIALAIMVKTARAGDITPAPRARRADSIRIVDNGPGIHDTYIGGNQLLRSDVGDTGTVLLLDSARMIDLRLTVPSMIYQLSHNSFADYVANEHIDWTNAADETFGLVGGNAKQLNINSRGLYTYGLFNVDCLNDRVGIALCAVARKTLHVGGDALIDSTLTLGGGHNRVAGDAQTTTYSYRSTARYTAITDTSIIGEYDIPASGDTCALTYTAKITGICDSSGTYLGQMVSAIYNGCYHKAGATVITDTVRQYCFDNSKNFHISIVPGTDGPRFRGYLSYDSDRTSRVRWTAVVEVNENMVNQ
jgi:hypothetical protein